MRDVVINIDGEAVEAREGGNIFLATERANIYIPSLCYHPDRMR